MASPQFQDQEKQASLRHQKQLWMMRWFFAIFFCFFAIMSTLAYFMTFYIIITFLSKYATLAPLIPVFSSMGLAPSFWLLARRLTKYLFPMSRWDFELERERLRSRDVTRHRAKHGIYDEMTRSRMKYLDRRKQNSNYDKNVADLKKEVRR